MKIKNLETNHWNSYSPALRRFFPLLHHNKFIVFSKKIDENYVPTKVFSGAGNFTKVAFKKNFENFYMISVKSALMSYSKQYSKLWNEMSTEQNKLPKLNSAPKVITNDPAKRANL